ncbi:MAG: hypothetical protein K0R82_2093 [Flavipsychrobacter sp.]|jgi:hypothetical protein|nr:hypothetical protein [Flavipsychrobacter sp.]
MKLLAAILAAPQKTGVYPAPTIAELRILACVELRIARGSYSRAYTVGRPTDV